MWLLASNITSQRPNKKLDHKQYGPFSVLERIGSHAYRLALPETMKIHDVFHVSLLKKYVPNPGHILDLDDNVIVNHKEIWVEQEQILKIREKPLLNRVLRDVLV